jgi:nicotinamidase-related amidase
MPVIHRESSTLLVVDIQSRLMPAIENGAAVVANARRLLDGATLLDVPVLFTEQNARGLGGTLPELQADPGNIAHKMTFDACRAPGFLHALPNRPDIVICGCETHVWVRVGAYSRCATPLVRAARKARRPQSGVWSEMARCPCSVNAGAAG